MMTGRRKENKMKGKKTSKSRTDANNIQFPIVARTNEYTVEQRAVVSTWAHERPHTKEKMSTIRKRFEERFGIPAPPKITILRWEKKLFTLGSVLDKPRTGRKMKRQDMCAGVAASLQHSPGQSTRKRSLALGIPRTTMMRYIKKDLGLQNLSNELCENVSTNGKSDIENEKQTEYTEEEEEDEEEELVTSDPFT